MRESSHTNGGAKRQRKLDAWAAAILGCILLVVGIARVLAASAHQAATPPAAPTVSFTATTGPVLMVSRTLAGAAQLAGPLQALPLPDGKIVVVDGDHHRLAVLDATGRLLRSIGAGSAPFVQPYGIAATANGFDVLDAQTGTIDRFDTAARFVSRVAQSPLLRVGRGLAAAPDGHIYVANPLTNSIVVLSASGSIEREIKSPLAAGRGQFNQPSSVSVGPDGNLYIVDSQNMRIEELTPAGGYVGQWPLPASATDTIHPLHVVPLGGGRLVTVDTAGALLIYRPGAAPVRYALQLGGVVMTPGGTRLLDVARTRDGALLLTDNGGNRLLVTTLPR